MKALLLTALLTFSTIASADVKMTIYRLMPDGEIQTIVQQFEDQDGWMMWMETKFENEGCDPYVTHFEVDLRYETLN